MGQQTKALYNALQIHAIEEPSIKCESWQIEDLRKTPLEELFSRLMKFGLKLDKQSVVLYGEEFDAPEQMAECLIEDKENYDQIFLILFELWRRINHQKKSLSVFLDELDHRIFLYDQNKLSNDELIQDALSELETILDENAEIGEEPVEVFKVIQENLAHDLETFLYDYISEQIDGKHEVYAADLIQAFYPYIPDLKWFDLLRIRLLANDVEEVKEIVASLMDEMPQEKDIDFLFELLRHLVIFDEEIFLEIVQMTVPLLLTEGDFLELLEILADYFLRHDLEAKEKQMHRIILQRESIDPAMKIDPEDLDIKTVSQMVSKTRSGQKSMKSQDENR